VRPLVLVTTVKTSTAPPGRCASINHAPLIFLRVADSPGTNLLVILSTLAKRVVRIKQLLKNKAFWKIVSEVAIGLLAMIRQQNAAQTDAERTKAGAALEAKLEEARLKRMELEVELKKRELDLQKAFFELEKAKIEATHAGSKSNIASAQKAVKAAEMETVVSSERVDEVSHAVTVLKRVEEAGGARDVKALERLTSALVLVSPEAAG
jgi:hypothetical protein